MYIYIYIYIQVLQGLGAFLAKLFLRLAPKAAHGLQSNKRLCTDNSLQLEVAGVELGNWAIGLGASDLNALPPAVARSGDKD